MRLINTFSCFGIAASLSGLLIATPVSAAEVEVVWEKPESYADLRPANESRTRFRERVMTQLASHIETLAETMPSEQTLSITVTNLDLAGQVWPSQFVGFGTGGGDVRLIQRVDIPRMSLNYKLTDESGNILQEAHDVKIKDMDFLDSNMRRTGRDSLSYEKAMLDEWFADTFSTNVAASG